MVAGVVQPIPPPHEEGFRVVSGGWSHREVGQRFRGARNVVVPGAESALSHQHPDGQVRRAKLFAQHESGGGRAVEVGLGGLRWDGMGCLDEVRRVR